MSRIDRLNMKALLALEDGRIFRCRSFTGPGDAVGEVVFNTSMTGYQEILTDPSYRGQIVNMTYPLIGNYGVNSEDEESEGIQVAGFIVKEYQGDYSNFRAETSLAEYMGNRNILGVEALDTRALTRHIRNAGAMRAAISTNDLEPESLIKKANGIDPMTGRDLVKDVTTSVPYCLRADGISFISTKPDKNVWDTGGVRQRVAAFDFGIKYNIIRMLEKAGCETVILPAHTSAETVKRMSPDGIFLSNGPGDPEPVKYAVDTIKQLLGHRPIFGICLGHQLLGLALGGETYKLKFGHRGANQPVKNLLTGRVEITSQNHGFALKTDSMPDDVEITHMNLNDDTLEGFRHKKFPAMSVQYHPEAAPGPNDAKYLFGEFVRMMKGGRKL